LEITSKNVKDNEFQECWLYEYNGEFKVDEEEVEVAKYETEEEVKQQLTNEAIQFTPWGRRDLTLFVYGNDPYDGKVILQ